MGLYKYIIITLIIVPTLILAQKNNWQVIGKMPRPVYGGEAIVHDSLIYIFGGKDSLESVINDIQTYNPRNQRWERVGKMQQNRYGFVLDKLNDTTIIACGGVWENTDNVNSIEKWDFPSYDNEQNRITNFNNNFNRIFSSGHIYKNKLYLFGGITSLVTSNMVLPFIVVYDLQNQNFKTLEDSLYHQSDLLPYHHTSVRVGNKVYLFGGVHNGISKRIFIFDLDSHQLNAISSFIGVRAGGKAAFWKDSVYLIGGYDELLNVLNSTDIFHLNSRQTTRGPGLNYNRQELMTVVYDGAIYVFGGKDFYQKTVPWIEKLDLLYPTIIEQPNPKTIHTFLLLDNYPNPFNGTTVIPFMLARSQTVRLDVFSVSGQHIKTLVNNHYPAGLHTIKWDGTDSRCTPVASSVYIYRLQSGQDISTKKMILLR